MKKWLIIATALVVVGSLIFVIVMTINNWDFTKLSTVKYETNTYEVTEKFNSILIDVSTEDINFVLSNDGSCKVVCHEEEKLKHSVDVKNGTLTIKETNTKEWYDNIGITIGSTKTTVYLPEGEYEKLVIDTSTSDIEISGDYYFYSIDISVSTGSVDLTDVNCKTLATKGSTGDISLKNVIADESITIKRSTGNVDFVKCDANEITVKVSTGYVKGSLLSDKVFYAKTSTGSVNVPKTTAGGVCEITTSTGDINIEIE